MCRAAVTVLAAAKPAPPGEQGTSAEELPHALGHGPGRSAGSIGLDPDAISKTLLNCSVGVHVLLLSSLGSRGHRTEREGRLASHPVYNLAQGLLGYAGELSAQVSDALLPLTDADRAELLRILAQATEKIARCAGEISRASGGSEYAQSLIEEAADEIEVAGWHLEEAGVQLLGGRATEAAWMAGAEHGRAGRPPAITSEDGRFAWHGEDAAALAASLVLPAGKGTDSEAAHWAAVAYRDAYAEATGQAASQPGRYLAGQQVTTALGRQGALTGGAGFMGYPRVRFSDGQESTVPRGAIEGPLVHVLGTQEELAAATHPDPTRASRPVAAGDILLVQSDKSTWLFAGGTAQLATEAVLPARYSSREEAGLRLARELASPDGTPSNLARTEFPAPLTALRPSAASARKGRATPSRSGPPQSPSP